MSATFKEEMIRRELLRRQGKMSIEEAIYEFREAFGLLPSDLAQRRAEALAGEPTVAPAEFPEWLAVVLAAREQFAEWLRKYIPQPREKQGFTAPEAVERVLPIGTIPALFVRPDRSTEEGQVDVFALPRLSPGGVLSIVVRIQKKFCSPGKPVQAALLAALTGTPVCGVVQVAVGEPKSLSFDLPADLQVAWRGLAKLEWEKLPLRFVVHGAAPQQPEEPEHTAAGVLPWSRFRLPNDLRFPLAMSGFRRRLSA